MTAPLNNRQWIGFKGTSSPETHGFLPSNIGVCLGVPVSIFPSSNSVKMTAESFNFSSAIKISLASWRPWRWFFLLSKRDSQFSWIILVSYISLIKNWLVIYIYIIIHTLDNYIFSWIIIPNVLVSSVPYDQLWSSSNRVLEHCSSGDHITLKWMGKRCEHVNILRMQ